MKILETLETYLRENRVPFRRTDTVITMRAPLVIVHVNDGRMLAARFDNARVGITDEYVTIDDTLVARIDTITFFSGGIRFDGAPDLRVFLWLKEGENDG